MYIKIDKYKIKINKLDTFGKRIKSLRFFFPPIKEGYLFEKKRGINTYFFCQGTDIIMTDKEDKILYIYPNTITEKIIFPKRKVYNIYILPLGAGPLLKVGDKLKRKED